MKIGAEKAQLIGDAPEKPTDEVASSNRYLSTDIMVEILLHLPVRSVLRFRCVCKQWRDILSDTRFLQHHFKQSHKRTSLQKKSLLLFDRSRGHLGLPDQALVFDVSKRTNRCLWKGSLTDNHYMIGACNGLLCLKAYCWNGNGHEEMIILANPVTGETLTIAPPHTMHQCMATYGFGFHPETQQFKIIRFPCCGIMFGEFNKTQVYTLGDMSWREVMTPFASYYRSGNVVSVGGAVYWIREDSGEIFSFDFKEEHITSIKLPPPFNVYPMEPPNYTLTEVNGRLCVATWLEKLSRDTDLDIWCLEDGAGERYWSLLYCVSFHMVPWWCLQQDYFIHEGYFLLAAWSPNTTAHKIGEKYILHIDNKTKGIELKIGDANFASIHVSTFAYAESFAPLSIYRT